MRPNKGFQSKIAFIIMALLFFAVVLSACDEEGRQERPAQLSLVAGTFAPLVDTLPPAVPGQAPTPAPGETPAPTAVVYVNGSPIPNIQVFITPPSVVTFPGQANRAGDLSGKYDVRYGWITAAKIEEIIRLYPLPQLNDQGQPTGATVPNPLTGKANFFLQMGQKYRLNPAYAIAFAIKESSMGTTGIAPSTYNLYGIRYGPTCVVSKEKVGADGKNRSFCVYNSLEEGIEAWFKRIREQYVDGGLGRGNLVTVDQIVPVYAPASDSNNVDQYITQVKNRIDQWGAAGA